MNLENPTPQTAPLSETLQVSPLPDSSKREEGTNQDKVAERQAESCSLYRALTHIAPLFLVLIVAIQAWPDFWHAYLGSALYCPAEAQHIKIAQEVALAAQYYAPMTSLPAQWPAYTWLILAFGAVLPPALQWLVYPAASAFPALLAILGIWIYAGGAGFGRSAALAASLIALCAPLFAPLVHFVGPSALASALMLFSLAMFCQGWQAESAWLALPGAFVAAGLAGLTGGPFFMLVPLVTSFLFLCWRCTFRRGHALDATFGFLLLLLLVAGWLGCVILFTHAEQYMQALFENIAQPWQLPRAMWWSPLALAGIGLVPWLTVVLCVSWAKVIQESWTSLKASRKESAGSSFVWLAFLASIALAASIPGQPIQPLAVAILCLAAPLVGKSMLALRLWGRRILVGLSTILLLIAGITLIACHFEAAISALQPYFSWENKKLLLQNLPHLQILPAMGGGFIIAGGFMLRFWRKGATIGGFLLYCTFVMTLLHQPATLVLVPDLGNIPEARLYKLEQQRPIEMDRKEGSAQAEKPTHDVQDNALEQSRAHPLHNGDERPADKQQGL